MYPPIDMEIHYLRKVKVAMQTMLDQRGIHSDSIQVELLSHEIAGAMVAQVRLLFAGDTEEVETIKIVSHPATWWDHVKSRWFPRWWLARWPAKQKEHRIACLTKITRICPHIRVPVNDRPDFHVKFCKGLSHAD
jgi:hypothetical protein